MTFRVLKLGLLHLSAICSTPPMFELEGSPTCSNVSDATSVSIDTCPLSDAFLICAWLRRTSPNGVLTAHDLGAGLSTTSPYTQGFLLFLGFGFTKTLSPILENKERKIYEANGLRYVATLCFYGAKVDRLTEKSFAVLEWTLYWRMDWFLDIARSLFWKSPSEHPVARLNYASFVPL